MVLPDIQVRLLYKMKKNGAAGFAAAPGDGS
jgi:hypothetical protein